MEKKQVVKANKNRLQDADIMLLSFPRSGNTWIRFVLSDIICQISGIETSSKLPINMGKIIPSIEKGNIDEIDDKITLKTKVVKSHDSNFCKTHRYIYIFRYPEDSLYSYYFYRSKSDVEEDASKIEKFAIEFLPNLIKHYKNAIKARKKGRSSIFVSYEKMKQDPQSCINAIVKYLGLSATETMIDNAIANNDFEQKKKTLSHKAGTKYNMRKGVINESHDVLSTEIINVIKSDTKIYFDKLKEFERIDIK